MEPDTSASKNFPTLLSAAIATIWTSHGFYNVDQVGPRSLSTNFSARRFAEPLSVHTALHLWSKDWAPAPTTELPAIASLMQAPLFRSRICKGHATSPTMPTYASPRLSSIPTELWV
eukprot:7457540-Pyramimonas_sp.AAC.1